MHSSVFPTATISTEDRVRVFSLAFLSSQKVFETSMDEKLKTEGNIINLICS